MILLADGRYWKQSLDLKVEIVLFRVTMLAILDLVVTVAFQAMAQSLCNSKNKKISLIIYRRLTEKHFACYWLAHKNDVLVYLLQCNSNNEKYLCILVFPTYLLWPVFFQVSPEILCYSIPSTRATHCFGSQVLHKIAHLLTALYETRASCKYFINWWSKLIENKTGFEKSIYRTYSTISPGASIFKYPYRRGASIRGRGLIIE